MKLLVIGSGGREHAIVAALKRTSAGPLDLYCIPGNAGISQLATCVNIGVGDHRAIIDFVRAESIDLTVVGPEAPLAAGLVDEFVRNNLKVVGPTMAAARLESSKAFAKEFMARHAIPTADFVIADSPAAAHDALTRGKFGPADSPVVIKADGLAAGKGVIVARSRSEAAEAVDDLMTGKLVDQSAAQRVVIEKALDGPEVSVLLFASGIDYALMPPARDHKRIGENDTGPNTGGMGAITGLSVLDAEMLARIVREVVEPTLKGALDEGFPFRGILFIGLMLTADGPQVLEYNVRFGDPETQAILIRLQSNLTEVFQALVDGRLSEVEVEWTDDASACVVLASAGYPGAYKVGHEIRGLEEVNPSERLQVFHAGTTMSDEGKFQTAGGRVLGVTARSETLEQALEQCYAAVEKISWEGMQFRRDIGRFSSGRARASEPGRS